MSFLVASLRRIERIVCQIQRNPEVAQRDGSSCKNYTSNSNFNDHNDCGTYELPWPMFGVLLVKIY